MSKNFKNFNMDKIKESLKNGKKECMEKRNWQDMENTIASVSSSILSGKNPLFAGSSSIERRMTVGAIALVVHVINEYRQYLPLPADEKDSVIDSVLTTGAIRSAYLFREGTNNPRPIGTVVDYVIHRNIELSGVLMNKISDFEDKSIMQVCQEIWDSDEMNEYWEDLKHVSHAYIYSFYDDMRDKLSFLRMQSSLLKNYSEEMLLNDLDVTEALEHVMIDYMFDERIKKAYIDLVKSSINFMDIITGVKASIKKFFAEDKEKKAQ